VASIIALGVWEYRTPFVLFRYRVQSRTWDCITIYEQKYVDDDIRGVPLGYHRITQSKDMMTISAWVKAICEDTIPKKSSWRYTVDTLGAPHFLIVLSNRNGDKEEVKMWGAGENPFEDGAVRTPHPYGNGEWEPIENRKLQEMLSALSGGGKRGGEGAGTPSDANGHL
jgi:hypothetical protein